MKINAYAKLNLALEITGRRTGGYHTLDMIMQEISLCDVVEVERAARIRVDCENVSCAEERNTAYRGAELFFERTGLRGGANIRIQKNIPSQAGLGGGSSDAAAVLRALDELYETQLPAEKLAEIAVRIGADVPFFLRGGCARARGVGETLSPLLNRCGFFYLLVKPEGGVDTRAAYREYHKQKKERVDVEKTAWALEKGDAGAYFACAGNALRPAARTLCPATDEAAADLGRAGAPFALLTGSGSCVFGAFRDSRARDAAAETLRKKYPFVRGAEGR